MKIPRVALALLFASIGLVCGRPWAQVVTEFSTGISTGAAVIAITQGPDGNMWFTEEGLDGIGRITLAGVVTQFFTGITAGAQPRGITRGPDGNLWFAENGSNKIGKIDPITGFVTEYSLSPNANPRGITAGPDGNLWFTEGGINKIGRITPAGAVTEFGGLIPNSVPFHITAGPDGNLWFTENGGNQIGKIDPTTSAVTEYSVPTLNAGLLAITAGPDGNLWFTEVIGQIGRITMAGVVTEFSGLTGSAPNGIIAGSDGNLWFAENTGNAIARISPAGVVTEFTTGISPGAQPHRITSGLDGNLWFTETGINSIGRITTGGNTGGGSNVKVDLNGGASGPGGVSLSFPQVTGAGNTAGATSSSCPAAPSGFSLGAPAVCYDLTTTALFTPPAQVCINFSGVSFGSGQTVLLHYEGGVWVDVTTSVDTTNHVVCGNVNGLSPFVVAKKATSGTAPALVSAQSRRQHGGAGTFDLTLSNVVTNPTTEPRNGPTHTIIFTFDKEVTAGTAQVTEGTATASAPTFSGNEMRVPLTGVINQQYVTIAVSNVDAADGGTGGIGSVRVGFLLGDVDQDRVVLLSDLGQANAQLAQPVTAANFLKDVNVSGTLSLADKGITNQQVTKALPAP